MTIIKKIVDVTGNYAEVRFNKIEKPSFEIFAKDGFEYIGEGEKNWHTYKRGNEIFRILVLEGDM